MRRGWTLLLATFVAFCVIAAVEHAGWRAGRAVECALIGCLLAVAAWAGRGRLQNLAVAGCSLALGLAIAQVAFLVLRPAPAASLARFSDDGLVAANDVLGWAPRHPGVFHLVKTAPDGHVVFDVHATIDEADDRKTTPSRGERPIAFFGDSFVFGDGLNDGETLPQAFADLNGGRIPVQNLGFSGWAPSQNLAALGLPSVGSHLGRPARFVLFTATFHVERIACKGAFAWGSGPRYVLDGASVRYAGGCVGSKPRIVNTILHALDGLLRPDPNAARLDARDVETYVKVVEAFVATARRTYGTETTVLMEPNGDADLAGTGFTQARIIDAWRAAGIDVLVKPPIPAGQKALFQIPGDGHPTGFANRATARLIADHLRTMDPQTSAR